MANNVPVTPGSGANVATDQLGTGEHVQIIKLMDGTEDGTARIGGDATNGLDVDVTRVQGTVTVDTEATTLDLDSGGGTDIRGVMGIALATSGGATALPGDATNGAKVQMTTMPAASRTTDSIAISHAVDRLMNNLTAVTPIPLVINHSAADNTLLAAQGSGNIILVHQVLLVAAAAVTVRFESGTGGTALTGQMPLAANSGFVLPFSPVGWFKTAANALLNLEITGGAIAINGVLLYTVVT